MPASASFATRIALACAAPLVVVAAVVGVFFDHQLRSLSLSAVYEQVDEDLLFFVDELRLLEDDLPETDSACPPSDIILSANELGRGPSFHFERSGCPPLGTPIRPDVDEACFENACVSRITVNEQSRRVALRGVSLNKAACGASSAADLPGLKGCLYVWRDLSPHDQRVQNFRLGLVFALLFASCLAALLSIFLARKAGNRIAIINETFESFARGERTAQIQNLRTSDEIDALAASVNTALRQIQQDMAASERVNASLSHQLVAPLRRLRGSAQRVLGQLSDLRLNAPPDAPHTDPHAIRRISDELEQIQTELGHLAKLGEALQDFLTASRKRTIQDLRHIVDLEEICEVTAARFRSKAAQRRITILVSTQPAEVLFSEPIIDQMLGILIDNAIIYGPAKSRVIVACGQAGTRAFVTVTDEGTGPPAEVIDDVFSDALLKNSTFSAREGKGGHGIGLLTVRQLSINCNVEFTQKPLGESGWQAQLTWETEAMLVPTEQDP